MEQFIAESVGCGCRFQQVAPAHHQRLLALESEPLSSLVELIEMAATWGELEYGEGEPVIPPHEWIEFAETHAWRDGDKVFEAVLALASLAPARSALATVTPIHEAPAVRQPVFASV